MKMANSAAGVHEKSASPELAEGYQDKRKTHSSSNILNPG